MTEAEWLASEDPTAMLTWHTAYDVPATTHHSHTPLGDRKMRLFACAMCREMWRFLTEESRKAVEIAERFADENADYDEMHGARLASRHTYGWVWCATGLDIAVCLRQTVKNNNAPTPEWQVQATTLREIAGNPWRQQKELRYLCPFCKDDPQFRASGMCRNCSDGWVFIVSWLTPTVLALADAAYRDRCDDGTLDPDALAVLSDAMEEMGCPAEIKHPKKILTGHHCPECGDQGFWRSGQEFDHMKKCRRERCGLVWIPETEMLLPISEPNTLLAHLRSPGPHVRGCHVVDLLLGKE